MVRIAVPDDHPVDHLELVGTHPNESAMRVGAPRDGHVRIEDDTNKTMQIREDDDGRYLGCPEQYADAVRAFFTDEYDADYSEGDGEDTDEEPEGDESDPVAEVESMQWKAAETAILNGEYDDALGELAEADLTDSKAEAVDNRRAQLSDGED